MQGAEGGSQEKVAAAKAGGEELATRIDASRFLLAKRKDPVMVAASGCRPRRRVSCGTGTK
jgi:hypothetical protein